jgi:hypothetical protein
VITGELARIGVFDQAFLLLWAEAATQPDLAPILRERDDAFRAALRHRCAPATGVAFYGTPV